MSAPLAGRSQNNLANLLNTPPKPSAPKTTPGWDAAPSWVDVVAGKATLKQGMEGPAVTQLQQQLKNAGYRLSVDSQMGPETTAALRAFQTRNNIGEAGTAGPMTMQALQTGSSLERVKSSASNSTLATPANTALTAMASNSGLPTMRAGALALQNPPTVSQPRNSTLGTGLTPADLNNTANVAAATDKPQTSVEVPWFSQFVAGNGFEPGNTSCAKAAKAMANKAGATPGGLADAIHVASGETETGRVKLDPAKAKEGTAYIDSELAAGRPVVVGVNHKAGSPNTDKVTDHFVTITGSGQDAKGTYYTFHDPATSNKTVGADTNPNNRFRLQEDGSLLREGKDAKGYVTDRRLEVSAVVKNAESTGTAVQSPAKTPVAAKTAVTANAQGGVGANAATAQGKASAANAKPVEPSLLDQVGTGLKTVEKGFENAVNWVQSQFTPSPKVAAPKTNATATAQPAAAQPKIPTFDATTPAKGTDVAAIGKDNGIAFSNDAAHRSRGAYDAALNQFAVEKNPRYEKKPGATYCNIFVWDATRAMGAEIPHWVSKDGAPTRGYEKGGKELNADGMREWLADHGKENGWKTVTAAEAQNMANQGHPVVAEIPGHVGMVRPGELDSKWGPALAQAGKHNFNNTHMAYGFGNDKVKNDAITYWAHE
jgi:peptidoglycan hydrolase-like protein with peptidoglycan-binding domain